MLSAISEHNEHHKVSMKREHLKIICMISEIFAHNLIDLFPKLLSVLHNKLKDSDTSLH